MKSIHIPTRAKWRNWLSKNHDKVPEGIWLEYYKKGSGKPTMEYEESVEEALCFGWIDSIIKKIDDDSYCRKFTPRKPTSKWSATNKKRVAKLVKEKRMTAHGKALIDEAKRSGLWQSDPRPTFNLDIPPELEAALCKDKKARTFFDSLAPTYQKQFILWIVTAKRGDTKARRIAESLDHLKQGKRLGLK